MQLPHHPHPDADPIIVLMELADEAGADFFDLLDMLADRAEEDTE